MTRISPLLVFAVVIVLVVTAGCTVPNTTGPGPLITETQTAGAPPVPSAPAAAGTGQPGAAGTLPPGTCSADLSSDAANCGGCGYACPANALCQQGQCYCAEGYVAENNQCVAAPADSTITESGCPAGMSPCPDGYCYELSSSADNCGICGNVCPAGMICSASTCTNVPAEATTAPATTTVTPTVSSTSTLGPIGTGFIFAKCPVKGDVRCDGICVNLSTSMTNCGTCGHKCPTGTTCISGSCKSKVVVTSVTLGPGYTKVVTIPPQYVNPVYQIPIGPGY